MRRFITMLTAAIITLLSLPIVAMATYSGNDAWTPCAGAGARLGDRYYIYARRSNAIHYKWTDGTTWSGWTSKPGGITYSFPGAANGPDYICVFVRGTTNHLYVSKTTDGSNYYTWKDIGGDIDTAPSAAYFNGYMYAFVRGRNSKEIYYTRSSDGWNNWQTYVNLGGVSTTAPVAVTVGNTLYVYTRGDGYNLHERHTTDGVNWSAWSTVHGDSMSMPSDQMDFALACDVGYCIITNEGSEWNNFCYWETSSTHATVMKFQMNYDHDWNNGDPTYYYVPRAHVQDSINLGAKTIIFRTPDTKYAASHVNHWMRNMRFPDANESIESFIANHPNTQFWIEVGNETDLAGMDPWVARWQFLDTAANAIPNFRYLSNCKWMASMPTEQGTSQHPGWSYSAVIYSIGTDGSVQSAYDGLGTHAYGFNSLAYNDGAGPLNCTYYALARLPLGKVVWVTEAGINSSATWGTKGDLFKEAMYKLPSQVRGMLIFALTTDAYWNTFRREIYTTQQAVSGSPCATALAGR